MTHGRKFTQQELKLDDRFTAWFFQEDKRHDSSLPSVPFKLPATDHKQLPVFLKSGFFKKSKGDKFRIGVHVILDNIIAWSVQNQLSAEDIASLKELYGAKMEYKGGGGESVQEPMLPLLTQGVCFLSGIANQLTRDDTPLQVRKNHLRNLAANIRRDTCPPGVMTHITDAYLRLSSSPLMDLRRDVAIQTVIAQLKPWIDSKSVSAGWEVHYANAVLNSYADQLGIGVVDDYYVENKTEYRCNSEIVIELLQQFPIAITKNLTLEAVFQQIVSKFNLAISTETQFDDLDEQLETYGHDEAYSRSGFLQSNSAESYQVASSAYYYLWLTLQRRLSRYFHLTFSEHQMRDEGREIEDQQESTIVYSPPANTDLKFAYVHKTICSTEGVLERQLDKYDLLLMTVNVHVDIEKAIPVEARDKPILIKQGDRVFVYGKQYNIRWKTTLLGTVESFPKVNFPLDNNKLISFSDVPGQYYQKIAEKQAHICYKSVTKVIKDEKTIPLVTYCASALFGKEPEQQESFWRKLPSSVMNRHIELAAEMLALFKREAIQLNLTGEEKSSNVASQQWMADLFKTLRFSVFQHHKLTESFLQLATHLPSSKRQEFFSLLLMRFENASQLARYICIHPFEQWGELICKLLISEMLPKDFNHAEFIAEFIKLLLQELSQIKDGLQDAWIENKLFVLLGDKRVRQLFKVPQLIDLIEALPQNKQPLIWSILELSLTEISFAKNSGKLLVRFVRTCPVDGRLAQLSNFASKIDLAPIILTGAWLGVLLLELQAEDFKDFFEKFFVNYHIVLYSEDQIFAALRSLDLQCYHSFLDVLGLDKLKEIAGEGSMLVNVQNHEGKLSVNLRAQRYQTSDVKYFTKQCKSVCGIVVLLLFNLKSVPKVVITSPDSPEIFTLMTDWGSCALRMFSRLGELIFLVESPESEPYLEIYNLINEKLTCVTKKVTLPPVEFTVVDILRKNGDCYVCSKDFVFRLSSSDSSDWETYSLERLGIEDGEKISALYSVYGRLAIALSSGQLILYNYQLKKISTQSILPEPVAFGISPDDKLCVIRSSDGMLGVYAISDYCFLEMQIISIGPVAPDSLNELCSAWLPSGELIYVSDHALMCYDPRDSFYSLRHTEFFLLPEGMSSCDVTCLTTTPDGYVSFCLGEDFITIKPIRAPSFKPAEEKEAAYYKSQFKNISLSHDARALYHSMKRKRDELQRIVAGYQQMSSLSLYEVCPMPESKEQELERGKIYVKVEPGVVYYAVIDPQGVEHFDKVRLSDNTSSYLPTLYKTTALRRHTVAPFHVNNDHQENLRSIKGKLSRIEERLKALDFLATELNSNIPSAVIAKMKQQFPSVLTFKSRLVLWLHHDFDLFVSFCNKVENAKPKYPGSSSLQRKDFS